MSNNTFNRPGIFLIILNIVNSKNNSTKQIRWCRKCTINQGRGLRYFLRREVAVVEVSAAAAEAGKSKACQGDDSLDTLF
jgi:hypothetical protein